MFIKVDTQVAVEDLIKGMIVQSGNDACVTLAEGIAGSEENFAQMMNREAQRLGMKSSSFRNSTGLPDPQHYTTARDLSLLAAALIRDFPEEYKKYYSLKEYTYNKITQPNRNRLAQNFVQHHHGTIDCSSRPGETVFTIRLPVEPA